MGKVSMLVRTMLAVLVLIGANALAVKYMSGLRVDMTAEKVFTLSQGTKNILAALEEPITLHYFYSSKTANGIPYIQSYASRVESVLRQYARKSDGKIKLSVVNPEPFSEEEDEAVSLGIQSVTLNERGEKLYFGLAFTNESGKTKSIAFFDPRREAFLEQDLTRSIYDLAYPQKPVVGILSPFNMKAQDVISMPQMAGMWKESWEVVNQIKNQFDVEYLSTDLSRIPDNIDVLMLVHPHALSDEALYAIDQFVLAGHPALIFVDPLGDHAPSDMVSSNLPRLFGAWGIGMPSGEVVLDRNFAVRVPKPAGDTSNLRMIDRLNWLDIPGGYMSEKDILTAQLRHVRMASAGHFVARKPDGEAAPRPHFEPLVTSSRQSMLVPLDATLDLQGMLERFEPSQESFALIGRLRGVALSAFPERAGEGHAQGELNVIVAADSDMLRDAFWLRKRSFHAGALNEPYADNGAFTVNALENLLGRNDLVALRSRRPSERPFLVVLKLRRDAEERFLAEEKRLTERMQEIEKELADADADGLEEDKKQRFNAELLDTRKQLRDVQYALRHDIEGLGTTLKVLNITILPLLVILLAFFMPRWLGVRRR